MVAELQPETLASFWIIGISLLYFFFLFICIISIHPSSNHCWVGVGVGAGIERQTTCTLTFPPQDNFNWPNHRSPNAPLWPGGKLLIEKPLAPRWDPTGGTFFVWTLHDRTTGTLPWLLVLKQLHLHRCWLGQLLPCCSPLLLPDEEYSVWILDGLVVVVVFGCSQRCYLLVMSGDAAVY